jgi:high-affinity nickel-transport protein
VDADHIAAIDNTTRKLLHDGERPLSVGTWFSLGHSTIVVALVVLLVFSTRSIMNSIPSLQSTGAILGTMISGVFLWLIGLINVVIVLEIYRIFKTVRSGSLSTSDLEALLNKRGFMNRYFGRFMNTIKKPWQIYPVGVLFGLGFDTASEIALIAISVGVGVASSVPMWMVLVLPFMFTCGMVLVDTSDAIAMRMAYGWAFLKPIRKIYYNLTITVISILVAFLVGGIELLQVFTQELKLTGGVWASVSSINFETIGYFIIMIFVASWLVSIAYYRHKNFDKEEVVQQPTTMTSKVTEKNL